MSKLYLCFFVPDLNRFIVFDNRDIKDKEYKDFNVAWGLSVKHVPHDINQQEIFIEEQVDEDGDVIDTEEYVMYRVPINQINNIKVDRYNLNLYKNIVRLLNE